MRRPDPGPIVLGLCLAAGTAAAQPGPEPSAPPPGAAAETPAPAATTPSPTPTAEELPGAAGAPPASPAANPPDVAAPSSVPEPDQARTKLEDATASGSQPEPAELPAAPRVPPAQDLVSRHGYFSALALLAFPFGSLERGLPWYDVAAPGPGAGLDLSVGVSRNVSLGVWADLAVLGAGPDCDGCSTLTLSIGPLVRYHLVQGMRFDPQVTAGIGLRSMATRGATNDLDYLALDWLRFAAGGQWYATPNLAVAPFVALAAGATVQLPDSSPIRLAPGEDRKSGVYGLMLLGLRLTFDAPGR